MGKERVKSSILDKFIKLSLHPATIEYLAALDGALKNYHYYDLIKLNSLETIRNLSPENQVRLMQDIIENRRKISSNNRSALLEALLQEESCDLPANLWTDMIQSRVDELEKLYEKAELAVPRINKAERCRLTAIVQLHSIKNLNFVIRIKRSFTQF